MGFMPRNSLQNVPFSVKRTATRSPSASHILDLQLDLECAMKFVPDGHRHIQPALSQHAGGYFIGRTKNLYRLKVAPAECVGIGANGGLFSSVQSMTSIDK